MTAQGFDPAKFKHDQRALWGTVSRQWSELPPEFAEGAALVNEKLFTLGGVRPGRRVLDLATGAGDPALAAADLVGPSGHVVGIDLVPEMVAAARERAGDRQQVEFAEGDVDSLGFPPGSFDVVLSRWGLMFSADRDRLFRSLRDLLAPGGVLAAAVWGPEESSPMMGLGGKVLTARLELPGPPPGAPGPSSMSDADAVTAELTAAGFTDVSVTEYLVPFRLASPQRYADFIKEMTPPAMRKALRERFGDENDPGTWQAVADAAEPYIDADGWVSLPSSTLLMRAGK
jgi:enediyne biosynthesis protein CalE5